MSNARQNRRKGANGGPQGARGRGTVTRSRGSMYNNYGGDCTPTTKILSSDANGMRIRVIQNMRATDVAYWTYSCNPASYAGTRVRELCRLYSQYKLHGLRVTWEPVCPVTQDGAIYFGTMPYNSQLTDYITALPISNGGAISAVYGRFTRDINLKATFDRFRPINEMDVDSHPFFISAVRAGNVDFISDGVFYLTMDIELRNPTFLDQDVPPIGKVVSETLATDVADNVILSTSQVDDMTEKVSADVDDCKLKLLGTASGLRSGDESEAFADSDDINTEKGSIFDIVRSAAGWFLMYDGKNVKADAAKNFVGWALSR